MTEIINQGVYKHYKGNYYIVLGIGKHSESGEEFVVYSPLRDRTTIWIRPKSMFFESVTVDGMLMPRFKYARQAL